MLPFVICWMDGLSFQKLVAIHSFSLIIYIYRGMANPLMDTSDTSYCNVASGGMPRRG